MNQGWICPKCGKVYNPSQTECYQCNQNIQPYPYPWYPTTPWYPYPYTTPYYPVTVSTTGTTVTFDEPKSE